MESKLLCKQRPYKKSIDNTMSAVNEIFFMGILVLLLTTHELEGTWVATNLLPWIIIALVGLINLINIVVVAVLVCSAAKRARSKKKKERRVQVSKGQRDPRSSIDSIHIIHLRNSLSVSGCKRLEHSRKRASEESTFASLRRGEYREEAQAFDSVMLQQ